MTNSICDAERICIAITTSTMLLQFIVFEDSEEEEEDE